MHSLVAAVADDLATDVRASSRLGGGDVAESYRMEFADGCVVFAKTHCDPPAGFFTTEANGLRWLREPAVLPVPEVLVASDGDDGSPPRLVLEWIDEGHRRSSAGEAEFGRALARLHRTGALSFGREDRRTTGSLALPNDPCDTWVEFFGDRRLGVLLRIARDRDALSTSALTKLEHTIERLGAIGGPVEPLADGWEARVPLHQLAPLVVHAIKFGGGYAAATESALDAVRSI